MLAADTTRFLRLCRIARRTRQEAQSESCGNGRIGIVGGEGRGPARIILPAPSEFEPDRDLLCNKDFQSAADVRSRYRNIVIADKGYQHAAINRILQAAPNTISRPKKGKR